MLPISIPFTNDKNVVVSSQNLNQSQILISQQVKINDA